MPDLLPADGHPVVGIDSFADCCSGAVKEANLGRARADRAFNLRKGEHPRPDRRGPPGSRVGDGGAARFTEECLT